LGILPPPLRAPVSGGGRERRRRAFQRSSKVGGQPDEAPARTRDEPGSDGDYFSTSEMRSASCSNQASSCSIRWKSSRSSYDTGAPVGRGSHSSAGRCHTSIFTPELARRSTMRESADFVTRRPQLGQRKQ